MSEIRKRRLVIKRTNKCDTRALKKGEELKMEDVQEDTEKHIAAVIENYLKMLVKLKANNYRKFIEDNVTFFGKHYLKKIRMADDDLINWVISYEILKYYNTSIGKEFITEKVLHKACCTLRRNTLTETIDKAKEEFGVEQLKKRIIQKDVTTKTKTENKGESK